MIFKNSRGNYIDWDEVAHEVVKKLSECSQCDCLMEKGKERRVGGDLKIYCGKCVPKYERLVWKGDFVKGGYKYFKKVEVEVDEEGNELKKK